jgi:ribosomal protein L37AE/L43A
MNCPSCKDSPIMDEFQGIYLCDKCGSRFKAERLDYVVLHDVERGTRYVQEKP